MSRSILGCYLVSEQGKQSRKRVVDPLACGGYAHVLAGVPHSDDKRLIADNPMYVLHGIWWQSRFHLWGERSASEDSHALSASTSETSGEPTAGAGLFAMPHPQSLSAADLHAALGEVPPDGLLASIANESSITLWLPYVDGMPLASDKNLAQDSCGIAARGERANSELGTAFSTEKPPALAPVPQSGNELIGVSSVSPQPGRRCHAEGATLQRVTVPALSFSAADTVDLLVGLPGPWLETCSDSLRYWHRLARLVVSLLARQQFVPDVEETADGTYAARWRLFVHNRGELAWLDRYASAMPPVCRAVVTDGKDTVDPTRLIDDFLLDTADAVIRRILGNDPFIMKIKERAVKEGSWELCWLAGLVGEKRAISASVEDNTTYAVRVRSWLGQLDDDTEDEPPALCFTLIEPDVEESLRRDSGLSDLDGVVPPEKMRWTVRFDLRSRGGGKPLAISDVWSQPQDAPTILGRYLVTRRQHLLAKLTQASEVFPVVRGALASGTPGGVTLTNNEAHTFLHEWAPLLRSQGFGVALPAWAERKDRRLGMELVVRLERDGATEGDIAVGSFGLSSLLVFDWRVATGEEQLTLEELKRIVSEGAPLVRIRGAWVDVDHDAAQRALLFMQRRATGRITLAEAIRLSSGGEDLGTGLPVVGLRGTSWLERLFADAPDETVKPLEQPPAFHGTLRPYQRVGLDWLVFLDRLGIGACLADDMGLGKTIQMIALLLHERNLEVSNQEAAGTGGQEVGPTLLFAPMSVVGNWEREIQRFAPSLRVLVHHGPDRLSGSTFIDAAGRHDIVVTSYGLAQRDIKELLQVNWHRIALDEAQKIKNPSANQTIAIRSLQSRHRVALTGTPIENHLSELWSIMEMLNPGLLGSAAAFRKRFAVPIERMGDRRRADELRRMIQPFVLRRLKSDPKVASDLPEKMEMRVYCNLTPEQAAHYERTVNVLLDDVDAASGIRRRGLILATLTKLKQVCNHPSHLLRDDGPLDRRSGKCERLAEMLEEVLAEGDEALVFTQFKQMGDLLVRFLSNRLRVKIPFLHGGTTAKERNRLILEFQDPDGDTRIFLLSLKAGGFGLNLTKANHVFHFDRWWNPAVENQATDRVHRIGQTRKVQVHKFVCIGTIEDRIDQVLSEKAVLADRIVGSGDDWLTGLSTAELRDYFTLSHEAISET